MSYLRIPKEELTNEVYHNRPRSISSSGIKDCAKSVDLYNFNKANRKETRSMELGTAFHDAMLEPEKNFWIVIPDVKRNTLAGWVEILGSLGRTRGLKGKKMDDLKEIYRKMESTAKKRSILFIIAKELKLIEAMKAGIKAHELNEGGRILALDNANIEIESSFFIPVQALEGFENVEMELELRIRPDYLMHGKYIADLKSTKTSDPSRFKYEVFKYGYHVSAPFYLDCYNAYMKWLYRDKIKELTDNVIRLDEFSCDIDELVIAGTERDNFLDSIKIHEFKLVACENTGTGICTIFDLSPELLEAGRKIYREGLWNYINYQDGFVYGGYSSEIVTLNI